MHYFNVKIIKAFYSLYAFETPLVDVVMAQQIST